MARGTKHVSRTLATLRDRGYTVDVVERRIPPAPGMPFGKTRDYLEIIDLIAINDVWTVGIQVCGSDFSGHHKKMTEEKRDNALKWLRAPHRRLELWGWRKILGRKKDGSKSKQRIWTPRVRIYDAEEEEITWQDV